MTQRGSFYASVAAISTHFLKYRSTAIGIASAGTGIGAHRLPLPTWRLLLPVLTV